MLKYGPIDKGPDLLYIDFISMHELTHLTQRGLILYTLVQDIHNDNEKFEYV